MPRSPKKTIYGVHSLTFINRTTGLIYGMAEVLGAVEFAPAGEVNPLYGGSSRFPWDVQDGEIKPELSFKLKEFPAFLFEIFGGKAATESAADAAGACSALTAVYGALVGTTGVASAAVKASAKADLKFTKYVVKAVSATTVDVYAVSNIDFARGTDKLLLDDSNKITASPLTITASTAVEIPGFGIELTGGSGVIAMVAGDTATFEVKPPSTRSMEVTIGGSADDYPEFGVIAMAQKKGNGEMCEIEIYRCKGLGLPMPFSEKAYAEAEIKPSVFWDETKNAVAKIRWIQPT